MPSSIPSRATPLPSLTRPRIISTLLQHLLRGSGLRGLGGIPPRRGRYVRPLLAVSHAQVREYLRARGTGWREDATNAEDSCQRNRLRHGVLPLLAAARWRTALNFGVTYAVLTALGMLDPDALGLPWLHVVSALAVGVTMMLPCFITGAYTFTTTSASAFICAMRRMRVPEAVVIPCVVVIRFFPTIAEDYRQIRNAMALRGIASGGWGLVRHPAQSLEYILIPLLMNATNVAQDLSVAALTKGLGREGEHTSRTLIRMTVVDWLVMIVVTLPLALDIAGVI